MNLEEDVFQLRQDVDALILERDETRRRLDFLESKLGFPELRSARMSRELEEYRHEH